MRCVFRPDTRSSQFSQCDKPNRKGVAIKIRGTTS
jgi:hypothetical protein